MNSPEVRTCRAAGSSVVGNEIYFFLSTRTCRVRSTALNGASGRESHRVSRAGRRRRGSISACTRTSEPSRRAAPLLHPCTGSGGRRETAPRASRGRTCGSCGRTAGAECRVRAYVSRTYHMYLLISLVRWRAVLSCACWRGGCAYVRRPDGCMWDESVRLTGEYKYVADGGRTWTIAGRAHPPESRRCCSLCCVPCLHGVGLSPLSALAVLTGAGYAQGLELCVGLARKDGTWDSPGSSRDAAVRARPVHATLGRTWTVQVRWRTRTRVSFADLRLQENGGVVEAKRRRGGRWRREREVCGQSAVSTRSGVDTGVHTG